MMRKRVWPTRLCKNEWDICYQIRLADIYTSKMLDGALLVILSFHEGTGSC